LLPQAQKAVSEGWRERRLLNRQFGLRLTDKGAKGRAGAAGAGAQSWLAERAAGSPTVQVASFAA